MSAATAALSEPLEPLELLDLLDLPDPVGPAGPSRVPARRPRHLYAVPATAPGVSAPLSRPAGRACSVTRLAPPVDHDSVPVRLTRRGVVVLGVLVAALGATLVWLAVASAPAAAPAPAAVPAVVTVHAGDTLWSIAGRTAPGADPRAEVERLRDLNGLRSAGSVALKPGQHLRTR